MSKFHINKHGVPAPCKARKGMCPLGGASGGEGHFDNIEDAQEYADKKNSKGFDALPGMPKEEIISENYNGGSYNMPSGAHSVLKKDLDGGNVPEVLSEGLEEGGISSSYQTESFSGTPVHFDFKVSKAGENEYQLNGEFHEYSMAEEDFDDEEEYEEYLGGDPDTIYEVDYKFTGEELQSSLNENGLIHSGNSKEDTPGVMVAGMYDMARERIE